MTKSEPRNCPACKSARRTSVGEKNCFSIYSCKACGTLFTGHVPAGAEQQDYDQYYSEDNLRVPAFVRERLREILAGFDRYRETGNFLDIGFGAGTLLQVAAESNWHTHGIEVSKPAVEYARERGFDVFHGELSEAQYPEGHFDVVTASEILEHMPDPAKDLREIVRILRPGGLFWATTPSARSLSFLLLKQEWSVMSPPEHIQLYSIRGARILLKRAGFSRIRFQTLGLNPSEIIAHFRRAPAESMGFDRVQTAYQLNEKLSSSPLRKTVKNVLNGSLNLLGIGDSMKIYAETANR